MLKRYYKAASANNHMLVVYVYLVFIAGIWFLVLWNDIRRYTTDLSTSAFLTDRGDIISKTIREFVAF